MARLYVRTRPRSGIPAICQPSSPARISGTLVAIDCGDGLSGRDGCHGQRHSWVRWSPP